MKLLFVYGEEKVKIDNEGNFYNSGTLPTNVWNNRYLKVCQNITFISRQDEKIYSKTEAISKFHLFNPHVKFVKIDNLTKSFKDYVSIKNRKHIKKTIDLSVKNSDCLLVRMPSIYSYYAIDSAVKYGKPIIAEVVGCPFDSLWNHSLKGKILSIFALLQLRKYTKKASNIIYVSQKFLQKRYPSRGNTLACSDVEITPQKKDFLNRINKIKKFDSHKKIIIGSCGAIDMKYKGYQYVIKAISILKNKYNYDIEFQLVGNGNQDFLKNKAKKYRVSENLKFLGVKTHEDVLRFMKDIDIYVQPSDADAIPRTVLEAMSIGCPCIGSSAGGIPELIESDYIFCKGNSYDLSNKIIKLISKNEEMIKQATINYEKSKQYETTLLNKKRVDYMKKIYNIK